MMETIHKCKWQMPNPPKMFNSNMGKQSIASIAFNNDGWGCASRLFTATAIKKAQSNFKFEIIKRAAKEFCKGNTHILESLTTEAPEDPFDDNNEWVNLADNDSDND